MAARFLYDSEILLLQWYTQGESTFVAKFPNIVKYTNGNNIFV